MMQLISVFLENTQYVLDLGLDPSSAFSVLYLVLVPVLSSLSLESRYCVLVCPMHRTAFLCVPYLVQPTPRVFRPTEDPKSLVS
jgi:hypothetical protein